VHCAAAADAAGAGELDFDVHQAELLSDGRAAGRELLVCSWRVIACHTPGKWKNKTCA
jgi:hypothetical protein